MWDLICKISSFFLVFGFSVCVLLSFVCILKMYSFGLVLLQLIVTGRFRPSARPKLISWCSRKLRLSSASTSSSSLVFTHHPTVWTRPTSTLSPSGTPAVSLVRSSFSSVDSSKCSTDIFFFNQTKNVLSVALNYQTEGRVLQLNRAKFYSNGNCGYMLKPACMCEGPTCLY